MAKHRRGAASGESLLKEATILIPLTFNDKRAIPKSTIDGILNEIWTQFGGWTIEGKVKGAYRMQSGEQQIEALLKVSVILQQSRVPELETMVGKWCGMLGQEVMLLKVADYVVKFIRPRQERDER